MNKNLILVGGGLLALMALKPAGATTRTVGNGTAPSTWARRNRLYNNAAQQRQSTNQSISQALGLASLAKSLGLGDTFSTIGQSISGAIDAATGVTMPSYFSGAGDLFATGAAEDAAVNALASVTVPTDIFATGLAEDAAATAAADAALTDSAIAYAPWIAGAAAIDSEVFNGEVGQTVVDSVDGLGNGIASVFGW